jgi:hypothetical protein
MYLAKAGQRWQPWKQLQQTTQSLRRGLSTRVLWSMPRAASERYGTVAKNASAMPRAIFAARLRREPELEREFARDDASMAHEFMVGELP